MTGLSVLVVGFLLGVKHATEADHVTAVATLVTGQKSLAHVLRQGVAWGIGHSLTLLGIGSLVLMLGQEIPSWLAQRLESVVGAMLLLLGADVVRRASVKNAPPPAADVPMASDSVSPVSPPPLRALIVGMVHGMAGSAALIALSLAAMHSFGRALCYITVFGIGSVAGMAALSAIIAFPMRLSARALGGAHRVLMVLVGACSCALGALVLFRIWIL